MLCAMMPGMFANWKNFVKRVGRLRSGRITNEVEINAVLLLELEPALGKVGRGRLCVRGLY